MFVVFAQYLNQKYKKIISNKQFNVCRLCSVFKPEISNKQFNACRLCSVLKPKIQKNNKQ